VNITVEASGFDVYNGLLPCVLSAGNAGVYWLSNFPGYRTMVTTALYTPTPPSTGAGTGNCRIANVSSVLYSGIGALEAIVAYTPPVSEHPGTQCRAGTRAGEGEWADKKEVKGTEESTEMLLGLDILTMMLGDWPGTLYQGLHGWSSPHSEKTPHARSTP
jgi:hypothetical protein